MKATDSSGQILTAGDYSRAAEVCEAEVKLIASGSLFTDAPELIRENTQKTAEMLIPSFNAVAAYLRIKTQQESDDHQPNT